MADKNEYWKELFGDDFPEELADELGASDKKSAPETGRQGKSQNSRDFNVDDDSQWISLDQELFKNIPDGKGSGPSDTSVIPDGEKISELTKDNIPAEIPGAVPIYSEEDIVPEDGDYITDEDIDDGERVVDFSSRRRHGYLGGLMYFAFVAGISLILAAVLWLVANDVLALNKEDSEGDVTIEEDYTMDDVANALKEEGFIQYPSLFKLFAGLFDADEKIDPGTYTLSTTYDYRALINNMNTGSATQVSESLLITEGKTMEDIFRLLDDNNVSDYDDLMDAAANYDFNYDFLDSSTLGDAKRLEGFLFPDTYEFYLNVVASTAIDKLLSNFNDKMKEYTIYDLVAEKDMTLYEILTIASIIESETASTEEMTTISSVIYNRLNTGKNLEIDATIQYILEERVQNLTATELEIESPYNSYKNAGLPPTPISNPGINAIRAALEPEDTDYLYYALSVEEKHEFFKTYEAQQAFVNSDKFAYYEG